MEAEYNYHFHLHPYIMIYKMISKYFFITMTSSDSYNPEVICGDDTQLDKYFLMPVICRPGLGPTVIQK